jgi:hypothetical protein
MKTFQQSLKSLEKFNSVELEYNDSEKSAFHKAGKAMLKKLASELGFAPKTFEVRSCMGGTACAGEVILHAENIYIQLFKGWNNEGLRFLIRSCKGRKDYCGGCNNYSGLDSNSVLDMARRIISMGR